MAALPALVIIDRHVTALPEATRRALPSQRATAAGPSTTAVAITTSEATSHAGRAMSGRRSRSGQSPWFSPVRTRGGSSTCIAIFPGC